MVRNILRTGQRVLALTALSVLVTCTDEQPPLGPPDAGIPRFAAGASFSGPVVFVGAGDIATCVNNNDEATAQLIDGIPGTVFTSGDNAYPVAVATHNSTSAAPAPTLTGGGMANWEVVATVTYDTVGLPRKRLTIFRAMSPSPSSGPITITSSATLSNCQWIVSQWSGVATGGTNGSGAIVQTGTNAADTVTTLATSLAAFGNGANVAYGVFGINSNVVAISPGTGFTEIDEQPSTESTAADLFAEWAVNRPWINATWAKKNGAALGVEIKAQ